MLRCWRLNHLVGVFVCMERTGREEIVDLLRNVYFFYFDCFDVILKLIIL